MKKLLALVLALIMVLGLGVTAFAEATAKIKVIELTKEVAEDDELETLEPLELFEDAKKFKGDNETIYLAGPEGDDYYIEIKDYAGLKNIEVTTTGSVTAEIVKFDGETMRYPGDVRYYVVDSNTEKRPEGRDFGYVEAEKKLVNVEYTFNNDVDTIVDGGAKAVTPSLDDKGTRNDAESIICAAAVVEALKAGKTGNDLTAASESAIAAVQKSINKGTETVADDVKAWSYEYAEIIADALNDALHTSRFSVVAFEYDTTKAKWVKVEKNLLKITTADNYSAAYKEGTVKLTATRKVDKKTVIAKLTVISDVNIFEYEEVKWAADNTALVIGDLGYSDYITAKGGYSKGDKYVETDLRTEKATVVSTTAFRAIEGEELEVGSKEKVGTDHAILVTIDEVAKGQKGVNFDYDYFKYYDEDDEEVEDATGKVTDNLAALKGEVEYFEFGFLGDQVIASDFEIEVKLPWDAFKLRELFGKKVEEEDIITYYVLKDGVKIDDFTIDYKDDAIDEDIELEILGKAGDKLGYYTVTLDAPAAEEKGEENPNTGAESVVGVVAAMAVISLATAAAVSLKK